MPPREIELKLEIPEESLTHVNRSSLRAASPGTSPRRDTLVSVYFDTDKLKLRDKGLSLRVRRMGQRHFQTIKRENGKSAALFNRKEWETEIDGMEPRLDAIRGTALEPLRRNKLRRNLKPVFTTRVRRTVYPIETRGSEIELAIDRGKVEANGHTAPLCEVEMELKRGEPAELFTLAHRLLDSVPFQLASKSKAERGYELLSGAEPKPLKAPPLKLKPDWSREAAFRAIARSCLHHLSSNVALAQHGDPEGIHQMRVALRRLRAAMSLFSDMLAPDPQTAIVKAGLRWITGELGPARELDVFIKGVLKPVHERDSNGAGVAALARDIRKRRDDAHHRAAAAIESPRFRALLLDTAAWIEAGGWTRQQDELLRALRERSIGKAAREELRRRWRKILKRGRKLERLDPARRHKLRIQAKKLRYASDFFAGVFPGKKSARRRKVFASRLAALQDALGELNDISAHEGLTERLVDVRDEGKPRGRRQASEIFAAGRLSGREEARIASVLDEARSSFHKFARAKAFWR
jgi:inorganic triphosphatase YgiF